MDNLTPHLVELGTQLAASTARNTAAAIADKITATKAAKTAADQVGQLEQIVTDLIADKNELARIAQAYQQELVAQQLTPGDVQYITGTVVPMLEKLADSMGDRGQGAKFKEQLSTIKPLLSVETVNVLQLLGFNFRQGIGAPLTHRLKGVIEGSSDTAAALQIENLRAQRAAMELASDPAAYGRFREMYPAG